MASPLKLRYSLGSLSAPSQPNRKRTQQLIAKAEKPVLQLKIRGPGVRSGRIPVPDLIRLCHEAQNAVNRQAEANEGRKTIHPGPITNAIQHECTLELVAIKKGSTTLQFGFAKPQIPLPFAEAGAFGIEVISDVAETIKALGNGSGNRRDFDAGVLQGLYGLGAVAESKRISELEWIAPKTNSRKRIVAPVNRTVREHVAQRLSSPRSAIVHVDGVLDMADFKPKEYKCRIDPAIGASVMCTFDESRANEVQSLLRKPVRVTGEAVLQAHSNRIESLHIQTIRRLPSLSLGEGNFFASPSLSELASIQKVKPIKDASSLAGGFPQDEDVDEFLAEIYNARK